LRKQLLLPSARLSVLDTMSASLIQGMVSMQLSHKRTMCAIKNVIDAMVNITIDSYFLK
jgi:hypothetical protein